jgi:hypothetical protein
VFAIAEEGGEALAADELLEALEAEFGAVLPITIIFAIIFLHAHDLSYPAG